MSAAILEEDYGLSRCGKLCKCFTLQNASGVQAKVTNYGATLIALNCFDKAGALANICLGLDSLSAYESQQIFTGAIVGRYANRIANARFMMDGESYALAANQGKHTLHGGYHSLGQRVWDVENASVADDNPTLVFRIDSASGESGFPGNVRVKVSYTLFADDRLVVDLFAETDAKTPISLTHHAYFNLSCGDARLLTQPLSSHEFQIFGDKILDVDGDLVPSGRYLSVDDTIFDFRGAKTLSQHLNPLHPSLRNALGFDHNYCFEPWSRELKNIACVRDRQSGRSLIMASTLPGAQLYTGNYLKDAGFENYSFFCIEPQYYPNSPNIDYFPFEWCTPEQPYQHTIAWTLGLM